MGAALPAGGALLLDDAGESALFLGQPGDVLLESFPVGASLGTDAVGAGDVETGQREADGQVSWLSLNMAGSLRVAIVA